ncbi:TolC family protein [Proteiniphilum saccharofermentans]|uniref:TolC family protein n=1 Tax=Proteiniphilum saccharofermentans TaxID=1642647 RepID=UPI0008EBFF4E|nr:TolC family protein [Proteiniphilum saccharofermentans]SFL22582.1 Outer membrane efflux protein [Porphyromonadaceae bacterium KH3CP3RA]
MRHSILIFILYCVVLHSPRILAQQTHIELDLQTTVQLANDSSLSAFRAKNSYMASHWEYRSFKADRLPSLSLYLTPVSYNRDYTRRYDSEQNIDIYRRQQSLYSYGNLAAQQNLDITGGTFFIDSELGYIRNLGEQTYSQFSSVPIRVGYRQDLIGYNPFKWEKRIAPVKYEKAQKELIHQLEQTAETATGYFFDLAMAQAEYELAVENLASSDTLYRIGEQKHKIASIGQADLLTLKLDRVNAQNSLQNAEINLKRTMFALAAYLNLEKDTRITLKLPGYPREVIITEEEALMLAKENNPQYLDSEQQILQSEQTVERAKIESWFNAGLSASVGFNQVAESFRNAYRDPLQQDIVSLTLSIPLVDWGVRKGRYNMAKSNLNITRLTAQENEIRLEEDVIMTVGDFTIQQHLIRSAEEAMELAKLAYEQTRERFIIGKADINSLTLSTNRRQEAQRNYISALKNYWQSYFKIRKLTLFDFEKRTPIADTFDWGLTSK